MKIEPKIITGYSLDHKTGAVTIHFDGDSEFVIRMEAKEIAQRIVNLCEGHEPGAGMEVDGAAV